MQWNWDKMDGTYGLFYFRLSVEYDRRYVTLSDLVEVHFTIKMSEKHYV